LRLSLRLHGLLRLAVALELLLLLLLRLTVSLHRLLLVLARLLHSWLLLRHSPVLSSLRLSHLLRNLRCS